MPQYLPLHDRLVVLVLPPEFAGERTTEGGLIIPTSNNQEGGLLNPLRHAIVEETGSGEILYDGSIRELSVKTGDTVLVLESEVLLLEPNYDPSVPARGIISERHVLCIVKGT